MVRSGKNQNKKECIVYMKIWKMRFGFDNYNYLTPVKRLTINELWANQE